MDSGKDPTSCTSRESLEHVRVPLHRLSQPKPPTWSNGLGDWIGGFAVLRGWVAFLEGVQRPTAVAP